MIFWHRKATNGIRKEFVLFFFLPCLWFLCGCSDEQQELDGVAVELFARTDGTDTAIVFSSIMGNDRYRFILNALTHRLGRPVTIYLGEEDAFLLRPLRDSDAARLVVLPDRTISRLTSLRNPLVVVRQPGSKERFSVLQIHPIAEFRRAFLRTIEAEDIGGEF